MTAACTQCATPLGPRNTSGLCRQCLTARLNGDPEIAARRRAGIKARFDDPEYRAAHIARVVAANRNLTPAALKARRAIGRLRAATVLADPALRERLADPALRAENGRKRTETVLAWCPPEWRDKYRDLKSRGRRAAAAKAIVLDLIAGKPEPTLWAKQREALAWCPPERRDDYRKLQSKVGAAEAKRLTIEDIEKAERRRLAAMTSLERQLERVANGARVVAKPDLRRADHAFTLGGVAPEAI